MTEARITISGLVQGVFFRSEARRKARLLGLKGFVRNEADGTVYIVAQGDSDTVEQFVEWCKEGPDLAKVDDVNVASGRPEGEIYQNFEIRY